MEGCLLLVGIVLGVLLLVGLAIGAAAEAGAVGWLILAAIIGGLFLVGHRKERQKAEQKRRKEERREQGRAEARARRARGTDHFGLRRGSPVDESTPLPRRWAQPPQQARTAVENYRRAVGALRDSPQQTQLRAHERYLTERADECDQLARRAAELDRQLRQLRQRDQQAATELQTSVERAEARLHAMVGELDRLAAQAAHVSVTQSMDDVVALDAAVEALRRDLQATVDALEDLTPPTSSPPTASSEAQPPPSQPPDASASSDGESGTPEAADGPLGRVSHQGRAVWHRARGKLPHSGRRR